MTPFGEFDTLISFTIPWKSNVYVVLCDFESSFIYSKNVIAGGFGIKPRIWGSYQLPPLIGYVIIVNDEYPVTPRHIKVKAYFKNTTSDTLRFLLKKVGLITNFIYKEYITFLPYEEKTWIDRFFAYTRWSRVVYSFSESYRLTKGFGMRGERIRNPYINIVRSFGNEVGLPVRFKIYIHHS